MNFFRWSWPWGTMAKVFIKKALTLVPSGHGKTKNYDKEFVG